MTLVYRYDPQGYPFTDVFYELAGQSAASRFGGHISEGQAGARLWNLRRTARSN